MILIFKRFSLFDRDNSGYITINDFYDIMRRLNINFSKKTILKMVEKIDTDKNCRITLDGIYILSIMFYIELKIFNK